MGQPVRTAQRATRTMKARRDTLRKATALHADFYHRQKIAVLRAEGERLRQELRQRGVDPALVLIEADLSRESGGGKQMVQHEIDDHPGH
jgi:hypothetical protein